MGTGPLAVLVDWATSLWEECAGRQSSSPPPGPELPPR
jgi:hypothetical protein